MNDISYIIVRYIDGCAITYYRNPDDDNAVSVKQHHQHSDTDPAYYAHAESFADNLARFANQRDPDRQPESEPDPGDAFFKALPGKLRELADAAYDAHFGQYRPECRSHNWGWSVVNRLWRCRTCGYTQANIP